MTHCLCHYQHQHLHDFHHAFFPFLEHKRNRKVNRITIFCSASENQNLLRKHNAKSASFLIRQISPPPSLVPSIQEEEHLPRNFIEQDEEQKKLQISLLARAEKSPPRFPGSISPSATSLYGQGNATSFEEDEKLKQALEIRRRATAEILKETMCGSKLSINYSSNLVSCLPDFVDHVMIEAASMKRIPEFSHFTFNARAKTYIHDANVIPLVRWLKHNSLSYPQIGKLICMSPGNIGLVRQLIEWLKSIYVKGNYLGFVSTKARSVLERDLSELDCTVSYLQSNGVKREWMGFVVSRCPQILSLSMEELKSRVNCYLSLGMVDRDFGTMVFEYPKVLGFNLEDVNTKISYLRGFGLSNEDLGRLLAFKPQLLGCSIEERWKPLVKYLYYLGVTRDEMKRILIMKPMIFCVDLHTTIAPKVRFLQDIGIRKEAIGSSLVKFPPLLTYSLYRKIRPVVIFLITKAGVSKRNIGKVIALEPELIGCSIVNKLEINVKYFLSLGIPLRSLGEMIADFPMLLKYNLDILRPKYRYLRRIMVRPLVDLIEFPRYFSYSLENRIIPRHRALVENRLNFKLRYMLPGSDDVFNKRLEEALERRRRFETHGIETLNPDSPTVSMHHREETK